MTFPVSLGFVSATDEEVEEGIVVFGSPSSLLTGCVRTLVYVGYLRRYLSQVFVSQVFVFCDTGRRPASGLVVWMWFGLERGEEGALIFSKPASPLVLIYPVRGCLVAQISRF